MTTKTKAEAEPSAEEKELLDLRDVRDAKENDAARARSDFRRKVYEYLQNGGSPTRLGRVLGVTRGQIYQYRDDWAKELEDA